MLVTNVNRLSLIGEERSTTIVCSENFIIFENVSEVYLNGLTLVRCAGNHIKSVGQIILYNCTFDGQGINGTALTIADTTANITGCWFLQTQGSYHGSVGYFQYNDRVIVGGAIISTHSTITIHGSTFERNVAEIGGAIFIEQESDLIVSNSKFNQNQIMWNDIHSSYTTGSAIYADSGCIDVKNSTFENTTDSFNKPSGIVGSYKSSVLIQGCTYHNNTGCYGILSFGSNITLKETVFESNNMTCGVYAASIFDLSSEILNIFNCNFSNNNIEHGIIESIFHKLVIQDSSFVDNQAYSKCHMRTADVFGVSAGVVSVGSNVTIVRSMFVRNQAYLGSEAISLRESNATISSSSFVNNSHEAIGPGVIGVSSGVIHIDKCEFTGNRAQYGTVLYALNSLATISETLITTNIAETTGILLLYDGTLVSSETSVINNTATLAVITLTSCVATFVGNKTFHNNKG